MTPDLNFWGRLLGVLAAELALVVAVTSLIAVRIRAPQIRRALWQAALIALAMAGVFEFTGLRGLVAEWKSATNSTPARRLSVTVLPSGEVESGSESLFSITERPISDLPAPTSAPAPPPVWWPGYLWLLGIGSLGFRALALRGWLAQKCRRAGPGDPVTQDMVGRLKATLGLARVELRVWPQLRGPVAFGSWRPTIAVPADFTGRFTNAQREAMLAHEIAHLAGRDPLWLALADAVCALFWWHPGVWWARHQLRVAGEEAADEASTLVPNGITALAESLVVFGRELATPGPARSLGVAGSGFRSELGRRVAALLENRCKWRPLARRQHWLLRLSALAGVAVLGAWPRSGPAETSLARLLGTALARPAAAEIAPGSTPGSAIASDPKAAPPSGPASPTDRPAGVFNNPGGQSGFHRTLGYRLEPGESRGRIAEPLQVPHPDFGEFPRWDVTLSDRSPWSVHSRYVPLREPGLADLTGSVVRPKTSDALPTQPFHVDPTRFLQAVRDTEGLSASADPLQNIMQFLAFCGGRLPDLLAGGSRPPPPSDPAFGFNLETGDMVVRAPAADLEVIGQVLSALELDSSPGAAGSAPVVTLEYKFAEITAGSADDIGLDWLFGVSQTNNPAPEVVPLNSQGGRVDTLRNQGQSVALSAVQFAALQRRLEERSHVDILSAPKVTARSGQQAQISVADVRTIVTGVDAISPSPTNQAEIRYQTEQMSFGPTLDVIPHADADGWRLTLVARVTEFLGYDAPGKGDEVKVQTPGAKPVLGTKPLPRLRVREMRADALARPGETIALRGPMADEVTVTKHGLLRRAQTNIVHKRLYAFVTPVTQGPAASKAAVSAKQPLIILVRAQGPYHYQVGDRALRDTELADVLKSAAARKSNLVVLVRAERDAPLEKVKALTDLAHQEGIANLVVKSESAGSRP